MEAIGFLELNSIARGIEAADRILKTADTRLLYAKAGCPGKYTVLFSGEVAAVTSSLELSLIHILLLYNSADHRLQLLPVHSPPPRCFATWRQNRI